MHTRIAERYGDQVYQWFHFQQIIQNPIAREAGDATGTWQVFGALDYAKFYLGDFLLDVTVKMGTTVTPQGVTAIDGIRTVNSGQDSPYYDLQGRRISGKPNKGIFIKDRKIIRL